MDEQKKEASVNAETYDVDLGEDESDVVSVKKGTSADRHAMWRMGKVQELRRNFRFVSMYGFTMVLMGAWEWVLGTSAIGLIDGGTAGLIWTFLFVWIGLTFVYTSMAEMGSMAPTSGGQYHWVSEFAPAKYQKVLSYMIGWLCILGWQTGAAVSAFIAAVQIQGLIALNNPNYTFEAWHGTLLTVAVSAMNVVFNVFLAKKLPLIESLVLVVHIFGFFAVLTVLWVSGPVGNTHETFTTFNDGGGWGNMGVATLVGMIGSTMPILGGDAAVHMSEELRDASKTLPRAMIWTILTNGAMGWIMIITFCMVIGSVDDALASPTRQPYLYVFYNSTKSTGGATAMGFVVIFMFLFCNVTTTATSSRQLFAFARDKGIPFHQVFAKISPRYDVPLNALWFSFTISCLLSLINLGSPVALNSIGSLGSAANLISYSVSISCIAYKRIRGEPLLPSKFKLGRWGLPINIISIAFLFFVFFWSFFPPVVMPTPDLMNWSCLMFGSTVIFSSGFYVFKGRHIYDGPVAYVRKSA
ncbi:amino acid transporter [Lindgomyces ingoldianus]|uniref:Amino acid transporter n=1 Tax=Lindgomyces ingoldianus TaxID=673940 RepID=A0ACB6QDA0_9PLEO|nr:amino acid transporter [Lindgomyces ingoldianus]KAF2464121.1 amino acid transporter [Lindgomyces ingoldianus]